MPVSPPSLASSAVPKMFRPEEAAAEILALENYLIEEQKRGQELERRAEEAEDGYKTEKLVSEKLHTELTKEKKTIDELLNKMETMELESRAAEEEHRRLQRQLERQLEEAQAEIEEERATRLQHMFLITRSTMDQEKAAKEVAQMRASLKMSEEDVDTLMKNLGVMQDALRRHQEAAQVVEEDLAATTTANHSHKEESHALRMRLVEAEQDASDWRARFKALEKKFERYKVEHLLTISGGGGGGAARRALAARGTPTGEDAGRSGLSARASRHHRTTRLVPLKTRSAHASTRSLGSRSTMGSPSASSALLLAHTNPAGLLN